MDYLVTQSFDIVGRNVRVGRLEIDVLARKDDLVAVVEVRTRGPSSFEGALESVNAAKRERIVAAADRLYRERLRHEGVRRLRFDVIAVRFDDAGSTSVEHIPGAFTA